MGLGHKRKPWDRTRHLQRSKVNSKINMTVTVAVFARGSGTVFLTAPVPVPVPLKSIGGVRRRCFCLHSPQNILGVYTRYSLFIVFLIIQNSRACRDIILELIGSCDDSVGNASSDSDALVVVVVVAGLGIRFRFRFGFGLGLGCGCGWGLGLG